jgi:hypothetical protein
VVRLTRDHPPFIGRFFKLLAKRSDIVENVKRELVAQILKEVNKGVL